MVAKRESVSSGHFLLQDLSNGAQLTGVSGLERRLLAAGHLLPSQAEVLCVTCHHCKGFNALTWADPRRNVNLHAKEELPFGGVQRLLLILLLPEEHQPIALFRGPVNLHRCHLPILLELVKQPIFKASV